ncbi:hypothetical protein [Promineifilum sp.]|uniref:hypothetical protein n=1 Tax=Promineifilum sp. TaxID=2664178 RepID=UPI0035AEEFF8
MPMSTLARASRWALLPLLALAACTSAARDPTPPAPPAPSVAPLLADAAEPSRPAATPVPPVAAGALNLVRAFIDAPYRVVAVARNPYAPYTLIVANERAAPSCGSETEPARCAPDDTCGSRHTAPTCFFFVEPTTDPATGDAGEAATRYVTRWPDTPGENALATDSLRFVDERTVEFRARNDDASFEEVWWLDLVTGAVAMQSRR